jgi:hypothetical protein
MYLPNIRNIWIWVPFQNKIEHVYAPSIIHKDEHFAKKKCIQIGGKFLEFKFWISPFMSTTVNSYTYLCYFLKEFIEKFLIKNKGTIICIPIYRLTGLFGGPFGFHLFLLKIFRSQKNPHCRGPSNEPLQCCVLIGPVVSEKKIKT